MFFLEKYPYLISVPLCLFCTLSLPFFPIQLWPNSPATDTPPIHPKLLSPRSDPPPQTPIALTLSSLYMIIFHNNSGCRMKEEDGCLGVLRMFLTNQSVWSSTEVVLFLWFGDGGSFSILKRGGKLASQFYKENGFHPTCFACDGIKCWCIEENSTVDLTNVVEVVRTIVWLSNFCWILTWQLMGPHITHVVPPGVKKQIMKSYWINIIIFNKKNHLKPPPPTFFPKPERPIFPTISSPPPASVPTSPHRLPILSFSLVPLSLFERT